jgi:hypothetical protein
MQHTVPLSHYQADGEMLPLSAVGNKDVCRRMREKQRQDSGERASSCCLPNQHGWKAEHNGATVSRQVTDTGSGQSTYQDNG